MASDDKSDTDEQQIDIQPPLARDDVNGPVWVANQPEITDLTEIFILKIGILISKDFRKTPTICNGSYGKLSAIYKIETPENFAV